MGVPSLDGVDADQGDAEVEEPEQLRLVEQLPVTVLWPPPESSSRCSKPSAIGAVRRPRTTIR
jgi:hypothetical protein